jgi:hypothetical protein
MKNKYDSYDLFEAMDRHMTRPRFRAARSKFFYPSEASVVYTDGHGDRKVDGKCLRAAYFRLSGDFQGADHNARTQYIFGQGNSVEKSLIQIWKEMGVWIDNSVKFYDYENNISGELDAILAQPPDGKLYGVEVKSFYGYHSEKEILGNKYQKGFPKMGQLLQTLVYLNHFRNKGLEFFRMVYFDRGGCQRRTFKIELHEEGENLYPKVEGEVIRSFTVNDILARYSELAHHLEMGTIPPADFELQYSDAKIHDYARKGKVAKTKYEKFKSGKLKLHEKIGDWECSYCQYKETCWPNK